jgi:ribonuclease HII
MNNKIPPEAYLEQEKTRLLAMSVYENQAWAEGCEFIAGIDEVGRGPLAGPVAAAAVILPQGFFLPGLNDSKKISAQLRNKLAVTIKQEAVAWAIGFVFPSRLDQINILNATREAMKAAVQELQARPDLLLIDAVKIPDIHIRQQPIIKGDSLSISIASASVLAKVERDAMMQAYDAIYPGYGFARHKGYATREHLEAITRLGPSPIHRTSFEPVKSMVGGHNIGLQPGLF